MSEDVANANRTITITNTVPGTATPNIVFTDTPAGYADASSADILVDKITGVPTGCILAGYTFLGGDMDDMLSTAQKCRCDGKNVMRKGDSTTCAGEFQLNVSPFTIIACACNVEIIDAGQDKVRAE